MANVSRVRVELREARSGASEYEKERAFRAMFSMFKRRVVEAGIIADWKAHQYYESKSEKKRRKRKEATLQRQKDKVREHFKATGNAPKQTTNQGKR